VGRLPVDNVDRLGHYVVRVGIHLADSSATWHRKVRLFCVDTDQPGFSMYGHGELARELTAQLENLCVPPFNPVTRYSSDYPDYDDRWAQFYWAMHAGVEILVAAPSTSSTYTQFVSFMRTYHEHSVFDLPQNSLFPIVLGLSCQLGTFAEPSPSPLSIVHEFMSHDQYAGSIAWIAPTAASNQYANGHLGSKLMQLLTTQDLPIGEIYVQACNAWIAEYPDELRYAPSYCFFGDPFIRVHGSGWLSTSVDEGQSGQLKVGTQLGLEFSPNPIQAGRRLTIGLNLPVQDQVSIKLYDAAGRFVKLLSEGRLEAGAHEIELTAGDALTGIRGSGVYFVRAEGQRTKPARGQVLILR
jgi:hypothetical protein